MSNTNYKVINGGNAYDLIQLFNYGNSGITTGYIDPSGADLGSIFAPLTTTTLPFNTNYTVNNGVIVNKDLTALFNGITPISQVYTILNQNAFIQNRYSQTAEYSALIFEYTGNARAWNGSAPTPGICELKFNKAVQLNYLIVGGGGGGGQGIFGPPSGGAGGSGAGTIYSNGTTLSIPAITTLVLQVAYNGGGNNNTTPSIANCTGAPGGVSSITSTYQAISFVANGGGAGGGAGTVTSNSPAGSSTYTTTLSGSSSGGGGGSGGGAASSQGGVRTAGAAGTYTYKTSAPTNPGIKGDNGTADIPNGIYGAGKGGNGYYPSTVGGIDVPFSYNAVIYQQTISRTVCCGNGGGGGQNGSVGQNGGQAGKTQGGSAGGSSSRDGVNAENGYNADTNFYYGNGGGGAGLVTGSPTTVRGGNGAEGVIMLWWRLV